MIKDQHPRLTLVHTRLGRTQSLMNDLLAVIYLVCFAVIAGGAFALMTQSLKGASQPTRPRGRRHPEAPQPGEPMLYVDLNRERLEKLYQEAA